MSNYRTLSDEELLRVAQADPRTSMDALFAELVARFEIVHLKLPLRRNSMDAPHVLTDRGVAPGGTSRVR